MAKPGPPPKVTPAVKKLFLKALALGLSEAEAYTLVELNRSTVKRAADADPEFAQGIKRAAVQGKLRLMERVTDASANQWQAAAWMLERKWWWEFARRRPDSITPQELAEKAAGLVGVALAFIPRDKHGAFRDAARALLREAAGAAEAEE